MTIVRYLALVALVAVSCGPKKIADETSRCRPGAVRVQAGDGEMNVAWNDDCNTLITGYDIFINEQPMTQQKTNRTSKPFNDVAYPGDTDPDDGVVNYTAKGLSNGIKYYVSVRTIFPNKTMSTRSKEILTVCGPRAVFEISQRYKSDKDGYSLAESRFVRADASENDLYFISRDGEDFLGSPAKLDGFLRKSRFQILSASGDLHQAAAGLSRTRSNPQADVVRVSKGDWIHLLTSDGHNALLKVLNISGEGKERRVRLSMALCTIKGEIIF